MGYITGKQPAADIVTCSRSSFGSYSTNDERRVTLVNDQLDAQFIYCIIRLLQSSTCFEQRRAHHQEVKFY